MQGLLCYAPQPDERTPDGEPASRGRKAHRSPTRTGRAPASVAWMCPAHRRPGGRAPWLVRIQAHPCRERRRCTTVHQSSGSLRTNGVHSSEGYSTVSADACGSVTASRGYCRPATMRERSARQERTNRGRDLPSSKQRGVVTTPGQHERPCIPPDHRPGSTAAGVVCSSACEQHRKGV
jgi:hypothetical protein